MPTSRGEPGSFAPPAPSEDRYQIERKLGEGAAGAVYLARDLLDKFVERYLEQWRAQSALTTVFTEFHEGAESIFARWTDRAGTPHAIALLQAGPASACVALVALRNVAAVALTPAYRGLCLALGHQPRMTGDVEAPGA